MPSIVELAELSLAVYQGERSVSFGHVAPGSSRRTSRTPTRSAIPALRFTGMTPGKPWTPFGMQVCRVAPDPYEVTWRRDERWWAVNGYFSARYSRDGDSRVLAFRGTNPTDIGDLFDDGLIATNRAPVQALQALVTAAGAGLRSGDYLTGHSLGGALALITAAHMGLPAVSFNAPGVQDECRSTAALSLSAGIRRFLEVAASCVSNRRVRNIRIEGDLVSARLLTGAQVGNGQITLDAPAGTGDDPLARHGMQTCLEAVRRTAANYEPLNL